MASMRQNPRRPHEAQIAVEMWKHDGEPDGHGPTEVHRGSYEAEVREMFDSLERLGLKVVKR